MRKEFTIQVGKRLTETRKQLNLTQIQMAGKVNLSRSQYIKIEHGNALPNAKILYMLSTKFNISVDWLINGKGSSKGKMFPKEKNRECLEQDFGNEHQAVVEMLELMTQVPLIKYAVLGYFFEYRLQNRDMIEKEISVYNHYKEISGSQ